MPDRRECLRHISGRAMRFLLRSDFAKVRHPLGHFPDGRTSGWPSVRYERDPPHLSYGAFAAIRPLQLWMVINAPDCVDTPPWVAVIVWSPLESDAGMVRLN
jgi:hypothetical protein